MSDPRERCTVGQKNLRRPGPPGKCTGVLEQSQQGLSRYQNLPHSLLGCRRHKKLQKVTSADVDPLVCSEERLTPGTMTVVRIN